MNFFCLSAIVFRVIYEPKERAQPDVSVVRDTPGKLSANVNNASINSESIFLTYRRAELSADCNTLAAVDVCVIIASKVVDH
jgi:hypothetical protein